jgi:hypothetical protein
MGWKVDTHYTPVVGSLLLHRTLSNRCLTPIAVTKKRAGLPPARRLRIPFGTNQARMVFYEAGISTVSTTWITPLD